MIARQRAAGAALKGGVVGTLMTNFGLEQALAAARHPVRARGGGRSLRAGELLKEHGWQLGGENSGHIICLDKHTTGDGIVSALQVLHAVRAPAASRWISWSPGCGCIRRCWSTCGSRAGVDPRKDPHVQDAVRAAEAVLRGKGRVLLRPSGTEPVIRVMVEGESQDQVRRLADDPSPIPSGSKPAA